MLNNTNETYKNTNRKPSKEAQEKINIRKQTEQLRWALNCNFQEGDMFVTFSYKKEERPDTYEDLVKQKDKLIKDLRKEYKKQERELKYIYVLETGNKGARHIHMVLESIEPKVIKRCWNRGRINIRLLDGTGQYGKLAAYLVKEKGRKKKNFVKVTKQGKMNLYTPLVSQSDYQAHESQSVLEKLYGNIPAATNHYQSISV